MEKAKVFQRRNWLMLHLKVILRLLLKNLFYQLLVDDHDEIAVAIQSVKKKSLNKLSIKVTQEVFKLNQSVMNKEQGDQIQFSPKKS